MSVEQLLAVEYLTQLLNFAPLGVVRVDADGRLIAWNVRACEMLEGKDEDVPGASIFDLLPDKERVSGLIQASLAGNNDAPLEVFQREHKGHVQYLELHSAALPSDSTPDAAMLLMHDVTTRVIAEKEREQTL